MADMCGNAAVRLALVILILAIGQTFAYSMICVDCLGQYPRPPLKVRQRSAPGDVKPHGHWQMCNNDRHCLLHCLQASHSNEAIRCVPMNEFISERFLIPYQMQFKGFCRCGSDGE